MSSGQRAQGPTRLDRHRECRQEAERWRYGDMIRNERRSVGTVLCTEQVVLRSGAGRCAYGNGKGNGGARHRHRHLHRRLRRRFWASSRIVGRKRSMSRWSRRSCSDRRAELSECERAPLHYWYKQQTLQYSCSYSNACEHIG